MARILVVVDYQKDFVTGALGFEDAQTIEQGIIDKIHEVGMDGGYILCTMDTHYPNYFETEEGKNLPIKHCIHGTDGWKIMPSVEAAISAFAGKCIEKVTFPSRELLNEISRIDAMEKFMNADKPDTVELCGVVTDICVLSNAIMAKAALPDAHIIVHSKLCASNNKEMEQKAFDLMRNLHVEVL